MSMTLKQKNEKGFLGCLFSVYGTVPSMYELANALPPQMQHEFVCGISEKFVKII